MAEDIDQLKPASCLHEPPEAPMQAPQVLLYSSDDASSETEPQSPLSLSNNYLCYDQNMQQTVSIGDQQPTQVSYNKNIKTVGGYVKKLSISGDGMRWYDGCLRLWLYCRLVRKDEVIENREPHISYYSQLSRSWLSLPKREANLAYSDLMKESEDRQQMIKTLITNRIKNEKPHLLSLDDKLQNLAHLEKIEIVNKLIAEKEQEVLRKQLEQQKVTFFQDGLSFIKNEPAEDTRSRRKHIWCREGVAGNQNGFRPVHFHPSANLEENTHARFYKNVLDFEPRMAKSKSFIHGTYSYHPKPLRSNRLHDGNTQHAQVQHIRDFEWVGRSVSFENTISFVNDRNKRYY